MESIVYQPFLALTKEGKFGDGAGLQRTSERGKGSVAMARIDSDLWRTLDPLLDRALDMPAGEREQWLFELGCDSPDIAHELRELLDSEAEADRNGFLVERLRLPLAEGR